MAAPNRSTKHRTASGRIRPYLRRQSAQTSVPRGHTHPITSTATSTAAGTDGSADRGLIRCSVAPAGQVTFQCPSSPPPPDRPSPDRPPQRPGRPGRGRGRQERIDRPRHRPPAGRRHAESDAHLRPGLMELRTDRRAAAGVGRASPNQTPPAVRGAGAGGPRSPSPTGTRLASDVSKRIGFTKNSNFAYPAESCGVLFKHILHPQKYERVLSRRTLTSNFPATSDKINDTFVLIMQHQFQFIAESS